MKKLLALVLVLVLALTTLSGCDKIKDTVGNIKDKIVGIFDKDGITEEEQELLGLACTNVFNLYKEDPVETAANFDLVKSVIIDGKTFTVTWTVDNEAITIVDSATDANKVTVVLPVEPAEAIEYVLTATIADEKGHTATKTFNRTVPKYQVLSYADYYKAEKEASVIVEGIVVAVHSVKAGNKYNQLYVQDPNGKGGYYVYSMEGDPTDLGIKMGMTVKITGTKDIYNNVTHEIVGAKVEIKDSTVKAITPVDITSVFAAAESASDANLVNKLGMLVTIKGVEITGQDLAEKSQYYKFKLNGLENYIRVYATDCPANVSDAALTSIPAGHAEHTGWLANVTGVVVMYNGAIYLNPVNDTPFEYLSEIERTDAQKVEFELSNLTLPTEIHIGQTITLPKATTYADEVTITWTSNNECAVVNADGTLTFTLQKEAQTVTITATAKCGETATDTKTFTIAVDAAPTVVPSVVEAPKAGVAYKFYMLHKTNGLGYYFVGTTTDKSYYLATSVSAAEAVDVYLEAVDGVAGAYRLYFEAGEAKTKTYIELYEYQDGEAGKGKGSLRLVTEVPANYYTYNADLGTLVYTADADNSYFIGTYSTFDTFSGNNASYITGDKASNLGETQFVAQFVVLIDSSTISDETKVATEKENLNVSKTEFVADGSIELPKPTVYGADVTITWSTDSEWAVVKDGKLVVTLTRTAQKVTLTATINCGKVTDTKTFEINLAKKTYINVTKVTAPEVGVDYKFYLFQENLGYNIYLNGKEGSQPRFLATSTLPTGGVYVRLEAAEAEGTYRMYFMDGETKKYVKIYLNGTYINAGISEEKPTEYFVFNEEHGVLTTDFDGTVYYLGTYNSFDTISACQLDKISDSFPAYLATVSCSHDYYADCDTDCNECGEVRETDVEHKWDNACDAECNNGCGLTRTVPDHVIGEDGETCTECGLKGKEISAVKVNAEKANLSVETAYASSAQFRVNLAGVKYTDVKIAWSASDASVVVSGNVVTVTLGKEAKEVVLKATLTCGEGDTLVTETVEYKLALSVAPVLDIMHVVAPVVGEKYKFYLYQGTLKSGLYLNGEEGNTSYYLATSTLATEGVDVYLEAADVEGVENAYRMYFMDGETKKYVKIYLNGTYKNAGISETKPEEYFVFNEKYGVLTTDIGGTVYYLGTYNNYNTISASTIDKIATSFPAFLAKVTCTHAWSGACDTTCDACGYTRGDTVDHTWDNACDTECNVCKLTRETEHQNVYCTDTACSICGVAITPYEHSNVYCTDEACKECGAAITPYDHEWDTCDDTDCNNCGFTREALEHADENSDNKCDTCGLSGAEISAIKIANEKANLSVPTSFTSSTQFIVALTGAKYADVTVAWAASDACVAINGKLITVTLGAEAKEVTLTATLTCGEGEALSTDTATFTLSLPKAETVDVMKIVAPEVGEKYKFYLFQENKGVGMYLNGGVGSKDYYLASSTLASEGVDVYLEAAEAEGTYRMYFMDGETKKYVKIYLNGTYINAGISEEKPTEYFVFDEEHGVLTTDIDGTVYYLGTYSSFDTFSASKISKISTSFPAYLVKVTCSHSWAGDCDTICNACGEEREVEAEHDYADLCDTDCDVCGAERTAPHNYTDCDDTSCNDCDATRDALSHVDENNDTYCDTCDKQVDNTGDTPNTDVETENVTDENETTEE